MQNQTAPDLSERRARLLASPRLNGIDYLNVGCNTADNQQHIQVYFLKNHDATWLRALAANRAVFSITGGTRITDVRVDSVQADITNGCLDLAVAPAGDFSTYTLSIDSDKLDPAFAACDFSFKAGCPSRFDCKPHEVPAEGDEPAPAVDYMARDYASLRQVLLDHAAKLAPMWVERHEADLGMALLELLAYAGDQLSYFQDAVAAEAFLETARQRISVRRHARLIDYRMHDGVSARAFVQFDVARSGVLPKATQVLTRIDVPLGSLVPPLPTLLPPELHAAALDTAGAVFETLEDVYLEANLPSAIRIHDWGCRPYVLPVGATSVDLVGNLAPFLDPHALLLLEEVRDPTTGRHEDANPEHRQVVRVIEVESTTDPLLSEAPSAGLPLTRVRWDPADALRVALWVSARGSDGAALDSLTVARGNIVLAGHGRRIYEGYPDDPCSSGIQTGKRAFRFRLRDGPLSFAIPLHNSTWPAAHQLEQTDPREARPCVSITMSGADDSPWLPAQSAQRGVYDLLSSGPFDQHFSVETDDRGRAQIRFGDGVFGKAPADGSRLNIDYRVGIGEAGNVGFDSLVHVVMPSPPAGIDQGSAPEILAARNPLPAWGGMQPETVETVKRIAPAAFRAETFRAVTAADYARAAEKHPAVAQARASFRWTGSWLTVFVFVKPAGVTSLSPELREQVRILLEQYAQAGYDLEVIGPTYVPLDLELEVWARPDHFAADLEQALRAEFGQRLLRGGRRGFFHADAFTFAQPLYVSEVYQRIEQVAGVDYATLSRFIRQHESDPEPRRTATQQHLSDGFIAAGDTEVLRLDNDPSRPENGILTINVRGGA